MQVLTFAGGIGLFLLGMRLMTDGLKVAAGDTLRQILTTATRSRWRGLASGVLITTMVQSSSAVIFATIGFVNAGLLTLYQAIGVIYGSNLGTTLTSWIVALIGFNVNLQALAMPAIGIGTLSWAVFGTRHYAALGQALAGFGLFFLGIDVLRETFTGIGDAATLAHWAGQGVLSLLLFVLIGAFLTVLMQSSSAALAVTLTAAAGGLIPLTAAAAMVIGANVGTTSTAAFAVLGATAAAKRAAMAHVAFNLITGVVAFAALPLLLWLVTGLADLLRFGGQTAVVLAIFHTLTKGLGVALMWPITGRLVTWLERRFRSLEEDESRAHYLDANVQSAPVLALNALSLELHRLNALAHRLANDALSGEGVSSQRLLPGQRALESLSLTVTEFASGVRGHDAEHPLMQSLPHASRVTQYLAEVGEQAVAVARLHAGVDLSDNDLAAALHRLGAHAATLLAECQVDHEDWKPETLQARRQELEGEYQTVKNQLLRSGTTGEITARRMAATLEYISALHRLVDQATKAALYLHRFVTESGGQSATPNETTAPATSMP